AGLCRRREERDDGLAAGRGPAPTETLAGPRPAAHVRAAHGDAHPAEPPRAGHHLAPDGLADGDPAPANPSAPPPPPPPPPRPAPGASGRPRRAAHDTPARRVAPHRVAARRGRPHQVLAVDAASDNIPRRPRAPRQVALAH